MSRDFKYMMQDFNRIHAAIKDFMRDDLPDIVAVEAENHFKASFDNQGFTDVALQEWKARDVETQPEKYSRKARERSAGRAVLIGHNSGDHLRDSLHTQISKGRVLVIAPKVYAQIHNEGGQTGRNHAATMPKRQFMGPSRQLDGKIKSKIDRTLNTIFNG